MEKRREKRVGGALPESVRCGVRFSHKVNDVVDCLDRVCKLVDEALSEAEGFLCASERDGSATVGALTELSLVCGEMKDAIFASCDRQPVPFEGAGVRGRACRSRGACLPQSLPPRQRLAALSRQRRNLLSLVCRILASSPGYRLRPSDIAAENVGDLSCLSREEECRLRLRVVKDSPVRTCNIWRR